MTDLTTPRNRRQGSPRVNKQVAVQYSTGWTQHQGVTLNVSECGARLVVRHELPHRFEVTLDVGQLVKVKAETVWAQPLGTDSQSARVVGVRFAKNAQLRDWVRRQGY